MVVPEGEGWAVEHDGPRTRVDVTVPGRTGPVGGAFALAAADVLGVDVAAAAERISAVADVDGRYARITLGQHQARLLMLKNPARVGRGHRRVRLDRRPLVVALDPFGPKDTATMWEAPFQRLAGQEVLVTGAAAPTASPSSTPPGDHDRGPDSSPPSRATRRAR